MRAEVSAEAQAAIDAGRKTVGGLAREVWYHEGQLRSAPVVAALGDAIRDADSAMRILRAAEEVLPGGAPPAMIQMRDAVKRYWSSESPTEIRALFVAAAGLAKAIRPQVEGASRRRELTIIPTLAAIAAVRIAAVRRCSRALSSLLAKGITGEIADDTGVEADAPPANEPVSAV